MGTSLATQEQGSVALAGGKTLDQQTPVLDPSEYPGYHEIRADALLDIYLYVPSFKQFN